MKFRSISSGSASSTVMGQELVSELLGRPIDNWRGEFRSAFRELTSLEFGIEGLELMRRGLRLLGETVVDDEGISIAELAQLGWNSPQDDVVTVEWRGTAPLQPLEDLSAKADAWVKQRLAEPGFLDAAVSTPAETSGSGLLVALAAGAECSPSRLWVAAGGALAPIMRPNPARWIELLKTASEGSRIFVPIRRSALAGGEAPTSAEGIAAVAGLDVAADVALIAGWVRSLEAHTSAEFPMILAGFGYSAGASHVVLQAAQDAVMSVASTHVSNCVLAWLGTPTDSLLTPVALFEDRVHRHSQRSASTKVRDALLDALGGHLSRPPRLQAVQSEGRDYSLLDCSAEMQGPNYLIAKRSQRWRAMVAAADGINVAYCLTPAARTHSVLDFKILRATYRGAPRFGVVPFTVADTQQVTARLLLSFIHSPVGTTDPTDVYLKRAVHGGIWSCAYDPSAIWKPATILGWPALLRSAF